MSIETTRLGVKNGPDLDARINSLHAVLTDALATMLDTASEKD
jgi:hypothetical protein